MSSLGRKMKVGKREDVMKQCAGRYLLTRWSGNAFLIFAFERQVVVEVMRSSQILVKPAGMLNYLTDFKHHFRSNFPYALKEITNIKHCTILSNNVDHLLLNLTLSDIMVSLANASTLQKDSSWIERIRKFVTETLEDGSRLNSKQLNRLLGVSWRLMQMQSDREATESLIKAVYTLYQQRGLLLPVPTLLLKFFSKSYQKEELRSYRIRYRSKVLSRWLAGLPLQLAHLGSRHPELSTQFVDIIHTAAARANKELLKSLQVTALRIYDPQEGTVVVLSAESQQLLVQLVYFLPSLPADLLSRLSCCCIMGRLSANLAAMLIGILHMRSSFSGWKSSVKEWNGSDQLNISNEDYFSFLFSTLTGVPHVIQTQLSPVLLYLTDLDQFSHHWDITEVLVGALKSLGTSFLVTPIHVPSLVSKCILLDNFCVFTNDYIYILLASPFIDTTYSDLDLACLFQSQCKVLRLILIVIYKIFNGLKRLLYSLYICMFVCLCLYFCLLLF
ncbi:hypothetical protein FD755_023686 [Muntiacus reevesi]|uniref:TEX10-like TPR repeats domain-containing protein n=1 Tax=Muntiacus reevesi TaxID=9886 RepID=A0A5N3VZS1_MUNRE|nr:hypothetical protein FD755_023686 [Muntiacus reevesi]